MKATAVPAAEHTASNPAVHTGKQGSTAFFGPTAENETPFFAPRIQTKLSIGRPGDKYEQEADAVADRVVQRLANPGPPIAVQKKCQDCEEKEKLQRKEDEEEREAPEVMRKEAEEEEEAPPVQAKEKEEEEKPGLMRQAGPEEEPLQAKATPEGAASPSPSLESRLSSAKGAGAPMDKNARQPMEAAFGQDFSRVRIHTDSSSAQMNRELNARAFTHGRDIYFNAGEYSPGSTEGRRLLAHELVHVGQQGGDDNYIIQKKNTNPKEKEPREAITNYKYYWENPSLRKKYYTGREGELRNILVTYKEIDLWKDIDKLSKNDAKYIAYKRKINIQKDKLRKNIDLLITIHIPQVKVEIKSAKKELAINYRILEDRFNKDDVKKILRKAQFRSLNSSNPIKILRALSDSISYYKKLQYIQREEICVLPKANSKLSKLNKNQANIIRYCKILNINNSILILIKSQLNNYENSKKNIIKKENKLNKINLKIRKIKTKISKYRYWGIKNQIFRTEIKKYIKSINTLTHDRLVYEIKKMFNKRQDRIPLWVRFMILHFSGLRYYKTKSEGVRYGAHNTYQSPLKLIKSLTEYSINEDVKQKKIDDFSSYIPGKKRFRIEKIKKQAGVKEYFKLKYEKLKIESKKSKSPEDEKRLKFITIRLKKIKNKNFKKITSIEYEEKYALHLAKKSFVNEKLKIELNRIKNDKGSLIELRNIFRYFPIWVQKEIIRLTDLKLETGNSSIKNINLVEESKEGEKWRSITDKAWKSIISKWKRDGTAWRKKAREELALIITAAVCDQIGDYAQYARGLKIDAGFPKKTAWYAEKMLKSHNNRMPDKNMTYFKRPIRSNDIKPGSSVFWLGWTDIENDNIYNTVRPLKGVDFKRNEKLQPIINVYDKNDGFTYHVLSDKFIRTRYKYANKIEYDMSPGGKLLRYIPSSTPADPKPRSHYIIQCLSWYHEAVVIDLVNIEGRKIVLTFEPRKGTGLRKRNLDYEHKYEPGLLNRWNIFVGFTSGSDRSHSVEGEKITTLSLLNKRLM